MFLLCQLFPYSLCQQEVLEGGCLARRRRLDMLILFASFPESGPLASVDFSSLFKNSLYF